jgi:hypothetical protein
VIFYDFCAIYLSAIFVLFGDVKQAEMNQKMARTVPNGKVCANGNAVGTGLHGKFSRGGFFWRASV